LRTSESLGQEPQPNNLREIGATTGPGITGLPIPPNVDGPSRKNDVKRAILLSLLVVLAGCAKKVSQHGGKTAAQWAEGLRSPDAQVRRDSARALGALKAKQFVPELTAALKDGDDEVRSRAAEAMWGIGGDARKSVPELMGLLRDRNAGARLNAVGALGEMGADAGPAVPAVRDRLRDPDPYVRAQAAATLGKLRAAASEVVPALIEAMKDRSKEVRVAAIYALAEFGPEASAALPALSAAAKSKDGDVKVAVGYALKAIEGKK
jgi:HEAT repeat protein